MADDGRVPVPRVEEASGERAGVSGVALRHDDVIGPDGVRLAVTYAAVAEAAPTVVIAHGAGSSARFIIEAFSEAVCAAGYRLVTYDLRGHGDSTALEDPAAHTLDHHVSDLAAVADRSEAEVIGGVSLGAHAAAALATRRRIEGLLLCMPAWTGRAVAGEGPHAAVAADVRAHGVREVLRRAVADTPSWLAALLDRDWTRCDPASLAAALVALDGADAPDLAALRTIGAPTGVVGWPDDPGHRLDVAEEWTAAIPNAALEVTSLDAVGADLGTLGRVAVTAWLRATRS